MRLPVPRQKELTTRERRRLFVDPTNRTPKAVAASGYDDCIRSCQAVSAPDARRLCMSRCQPD